MKKLDRELEELLDYITDGMGRPERRRVALRLTGPRIGASEEAATAWVPPCVPDVRGVRGLELISKTAPVGFLA